MGPVPHLAGRSPSYLVRQMYDMQAGTRHGEWASLMKPVVQKLTDEDFVNIAALTCPRECRKLFRLGFLAVQSAFGGFIGTDGSGITR
jgi:hypothetical protein